MPTYRETWHFAGAQGASWEEVYEVRVPEGENQMPLKNAPVLLNRMACAHATVSLSKITSRNLEDPSEPPAESPYNLTGTANNGAGDPANTDEAAVILLGCQELGGPRKGHRFLWMRGLEETAVSRNATSGKIGRAHV